MIFKIFTVFPEFFESPLKTGLMGKAITSGIVKAEFTDIRNFSDDKHRRCDDYPYGGGSGMIMKPEPVLKALGHVKRNGVTILTSPSGKTLNQKLVKRLAAEKEISIVCSNYEGIDERVSVCVDFEISVGDYVLSGGEYAALIIMDAVARYAPGFMSNAESLQDESFEQDLLEYPQYTRPEITEGMIVPPTLLSGNHEEIKRWRINESIKKTRLARPDLYKKYILKKLTGE